MDSMRIQAQIRHNAEELSSFISDVSKWEKDISARDNKIRKTREIRPSKIPIRAGSGTVNIQNNPIMHTVDRSNSAAKHTYDLGYKKWESFDEKLEDVGNSSKEIEDNFKLTPANIVKTIPATFEQVPKARGQHLLVDAEAVEREMGNQEFSKGNFSQAVKLYTKCLGMKVGNYLAFSNRAMAYLKLKENVRAEMDCNCALSIKPDHMKSFLRRATARNALGKHRAALLDLFTAIELDPTSKAIKSDIERTKEQLRSAVNRAPFITIPLTFGNGQDDNDDNNNSKNRVLPFLEPLQGPDFNPNYYYNSNENNRNFDVDDKEDNYHSSRNEYNHHLVKDIPNQESVSTTTMTTATNLALSSTITPIPLSLPPPSPLPSYMESEILQEVPMNLYPTINMDNGRTIYNNILSSNSYDIHNNNNIMLSSMTTIGIGPESPLNISNVMDVQDTLMNRRNHQESIVVESEQSYDIPSPPVVAVEITIEAEGRKEDKKKKKKKSIEVVSKVSPPLKSSKSINNNSNGNRKKTEKSTKGSSTNNCSNSLVILSAYGLERLINASLNDDKQLTHMMTTYPDTVLREALSKISEPDVICNFLVCVSKYFTYTLSDQQLNNCLFWFEEVTKLKSFSLLSDLFSESDRLKIGKNLHSIIENYNGNNDAHARINVLKSLYKI